MKTAKTLVALFSTLVPSLAFTNSASNNLAVYWGQNSYGATHGYDPANWQKGLRNYCQDSTIDAFPLAFLNIFFSGGGLPSVDFANICSASGTVFPGTNLANCQSMASDIQYCQSQGKIVTLSLGGATGANAFANDTQAKAFADTLWNLFLGGTSSTRPFGNAVLDGIDLDIEGGSSNGYAAMVSQLRTRMNADNKKYYITAAPQCPYPDAYVGPVLNAAQFDAVYVQFYNNYCGVGNYPNFWNFGTWDNWAKTVSPNKNVKVYIGIPASPTAGGGYVNATVMSTIIQNTRSQYSSFGGVMLWDASQAYANNRYDVAIKNILNGNAPPPPTNTTSTSQSSTSTTTTTTSSTTTTTTSSSTTTTTTTTSSSTNPSPTSCVGVAPWDRGTIYVGGKYATYNGRLWYAKWWTLGDTPGGVADVWAPRVAC